MKTLKIFPLISLAIILLSCSKGSNNIPPAPIKATIHDTLIGSWNLDLCRWPNGDTVQSSLTSGSIRFIDRKFLDYKMSIPGYYYDLPSSEYIATSDSIKVMNWIKEFSLEIVKLEMNKMILTFPDPPFGSYTLYYSRI